MSRLDQLLARPHPEWAAPMLAVLTERRISGSEWIFERKLDGGRCLAFRDGDRVRLLSRTGRSLNDLYPELVAAIEGQECRDFVADGEVVAFEGSRTSFARLQPRMQARRAPAGGPPVFYYAFDLLHLDGHDTTGLPLLERKSLLRRALRPAPRLRLLNHRRTHGERFHREACARGWEGLIAKRADSVYRAARSTDWLKLKCVRAQEFVIGGFTDPAGSRRGLGALLIGYHDSGRLRYAGKVGTGYTDAALDDLAERLWPLEQERPPFAGDTLPRGGVHWVAPKLVAQVGFTELTGAGRLRHPRFEGLRSDKPAADVVLERPA